MKRDMPGAGNVGDCMEKDSGKPRHGDQHDVRHRGKRKIASVVKWGRGASGEQKEQQERTTSGYKKEVRRSFAEPGKRS